MNDTRTPISTAPTTTTIRVVHLSKVWPNGVRAVDGIDVDIGAGEIFGLLGANGAGKSTTIGMLTTTVRPSAGRATICGHDVVSAAREARAASAVVFQDAVVDRSLSGRRNMQIHADLWAVDRTRAGHRIDALITEFGLGDIVDRPVGTYSGGQRRRLEIARALLSEPSVLFLDEPTVGLDPRIRFELLDLIAGLRNRSGMTVLLTTHYLDEAERLCDRIAVMVAGAIVALDTPANLLASLGDEVLELRLAGQAHPALATLQAAGVAADDAFSIGNTLIIPVHHRTANDLAALAAGLDLAIVATSVRRPTLDDVYLRLTGDRLAAA